MATPWHFVVYDPNANVYKGELDEARSRTVTWYLSQPCTASFNLTGYSAKAGLINECATDLVVLRDEQPWYRGRIGTSQDTVDETGHDGQFSVIDYRGMLQRRLVWPNFATQWVLTDQSDVAWSLINQSQTLGPSGSLGIAKGYAPETGIDRTLTVNVGDIIESDITTISQYADGFDWDIDASLNFNLYYPSRGRNNGVVLRYGDKVRAVTRQVNPANFANAILYTGGQYVRTDTVTFTAGSATVGDPSIQAGDDFTTLTVAGFAPASITAGSFVPGVGFTLDDPSVINATESGQLSGGTLTPVQAVGTFDEFGGWEASFSDSSLENPAALTAAANGELDLMGGLTASYALTLVSGTWDPNTLFLGDTVRCIVYSGRLAVDTMLPVTQISLTLEDDASVETVVVTVGPIIEDAAMISRDYGVTLQATNTR